ncbi:MAG: orotidine-5'-phosphate decarboxylase [Verrucomicrobia bacterium]|nr:orotidine-5'-phosphate decarboxylase [Verrucomicrobiota bacterium]
MPSRAPASPSPTAASLINPVIAALDVVPLDAALRLAERVQPFVGAFKVGSVLFAAEGPAAVHRLRAMGAPVFLDLKFHDIPHTVAEAVAQATRLDVQMLTVHAGGGRAMMQAAETSAQQTAAALQRPPPLILGVTVLTSLDPAALAELGLPHPLPAQVELLARLAAHAGLRGLVCSPLEIEPLRRFLPKPFVLVTPGIRSGSDPAGDQKRTLSARAALDAGATWLVIGRPICAAPDPALAARRILDDLRQAP